MSTGERWRLGHRPALDGLRGVAVLLVLVGHSGAPVLGAAGAIGVGVFFTLSGFLITSLLLDEHGRSGRVSLRRFAGRRAVRLFPALVFLVVVLVLLSPVVSTVEGRTLPVVLLYLSNWGLIAGVPLDGLAHTWSLSIEEQFYLLWPLTFLALARWGRRGVLVGASLGAALSAALTPLLWSSVADNARVYAGSDTRARDLLIGCALAAWLAGRSERSPRLASAALVACCGLSLLPSGWWLYVFGGTITSGVAAVGIWSAAQGPAGWLGSRGLVYVGKRSYAMYLWHFPASWWIDAHRPEWAWPAQAVIVVAVAVVMAEVSWRLVERPAKRWASGRGGEPGGVEAGHLRTGQSASDEADVIVLPRKVVGAATASEAEHARSRGVDAGVDRL